MIVYFPKTNYIPKNILKKNQGWIYIIQIHIDALTLLR